MRNGPEKAAVDELWKDDSPLTALAGKPGPNTENCYPELRVEISLDA